MYDLKLTSAPKDDFWAQLMLHNIMLSKEKKNIAYICSPLRADTQDGVDRNMYAVRAYMKYLYQHLGINGIAPHGFIPYILDDHKEDDRELALQIGLRMLNNCQVICICGDRISEGMKGEIAEAGKLGLDIYLFNERLYVDVQDIAPTANLFYKPHSPYLALSAEEIIAEDMKGARDVM